MSYRPLCWQPWFNIEHIRDSLRFKARLSSLSDLPPLLTLLSLHGAHPVKLDFDKFVCAKAFGWRPITFDIRLNTGLIVEFYAVPLHLDLKPTKHPNHVLFERWRGRGTVERELERGKFESDRFESVRRYTVALWEWVKSVGYSSFDDLKKKFYREIAVIMQCGWNQDVTVSNSQVNVHKIKSVTPGISAPLISIVHKMSEQNKRRCQNNNKKRDFNVNYAGFSSNADILQQSLEATNGAAAQETMQHRQQLSAVDARANKAATAPIIVVDKHVAKISKETDKNGSSNSGGRINRSVVKPASGSSVLLSTESGSGGNNSCDRRNVASEGKELAVSYCL